MPDQYAYMGDIPLDDPRDLAEEINRLWNERPLQEIIPVSGLHHPPYGNSRSEIPRLTIVFDGLRPVTHPTGTNIIETALGPGMGIFVTTDGWTRPNSNQPHRYVSIDFYPTFIRYRLDTPHHSEPGDGCFYSKSPIDPPGRSLIRALEFLAHEGAAERMLPLMQALVPEAMRQCVQHHRELAGTEDWRRATAWIIDHLGEPVGRDHIAQAIGIHPNHLSRLCRRFMQMPLAEYLTEQRLKKAQRLLRQTTYSIGEIASQCGYGDHIHFRKRFKVWSGQTPRSFRLQSSHPNSG